MPNNHVLQRLTGIQQSLIGVHQSGGGMSNSSRGSEREDFIKNYLSTVLPPIYRFGTGDATDQAGNRSGQLDVVLEYPIGPSLPSIAGLNPTRLFLAETVAAVVEVKSDVGAQWSQALATATALAPLKRTFGATMVMGNAPSENIPLFVAGYTGWSTVHTIENQLKQNPEVSGVLVIDKGLFVANESFGSMVATGPWALWGLISCLHSITNSLQAASTSPLGYAT